MVWKLANVPGSRCLRHTWACLDRAQCAPSECKFLWRKDMILHLIYLTLIRPIWWSPMKPNAYLAWNAAFEPLWTDYMWHYIWLYIIIWLYSPLNKCCIGHLQWRKRQEGWSCSFYVSTAVNSWPSEVGHPQDEGSVNMLSSPTCGWLQ